MRREDEMDSPEHDPLESRLRDVLRSDSAHPAATETFLADVHRGARSRRRRQVLGTAAVVLLVAGGGFAVAESGMLDSARRPIAASPSRTGEGTDQPGSGSASSPGSSGPPTTSTTVPTASGEAPVLSLTSTGFDAQWALAVTNAAGCSNPDGCATVFQNPVGTDTWVERGTIPAVPTLDSSQRYAVSQLRFAGDESDGYNGWAFGGGLLSTHGSSAGREWTTAAVPAQGAVTALEAHGDTVYAVLASDEQTRIVESPVGHDDFALVDTGHALGDVSQLVVSDHVVAFLNSTGDGNRIVELTGDSTWSQSNPCQEGEPSKLSTAADSLWVLCTAGPKATVWVRPDTSASWESNGNTYDASALLAALSPTAALVAEVTGLSRVTPGDSTHLSDDDYTDATMFGFTNDRVGFVIADGHVLRTDDSGETWAPDDVTP